MNDWKHRGGQRYVIELEAMSSDIPPTIRLRHFLKNALRAWRLKARRISETTPPLPPPATEKNADAAGGTDDR